MIRRALTSVAALSLVAAVVAGCSTSSEESAPQPTEPHRRR